MAAEFDSAKDINVARFRDAEVVAEYATANGPRDCESFLFATYVAPGTDVLDLGVGAGRTAALLAPSAGSYLGVDYSGEMIEAARRNFPQYQFAVMDAADLPCLTDESFDVINFSYNGLSFLYPEQKRLSCISECHRLLRSEGLFIFSLYNPYSLLVRPTRSSRSFVATVGGLMAALHGSVRRSCSRFLTGAFWHGHGYIHASAHGGLTTFAASRSYVRGELDSAGFHFVAEYPEQHPHTSRLLSRWNYYVFRKRNAR
jgi:SAM-dependent methyltransferase